MNKIVLGVMLLCSATFYCQMPYDFEPEADRKCLAVYLLDDQSDYTQYLRIFDHELESLVYFKQGDTLCELTRCRYQKVKQHYQIGTVLDVKRIFRKDSLTFAINFNSLQRYHVPNDEDVFQIWKVNELLCQPSSKHVFYPNKLFAVLKIKPELTPTVINSLVKPWYFDPASNRNLISASCTEGQNFACMCAALQYGGANQKQTAQQIADYLINRFSYGYGDTSQYRPLGLLLGEQNLAVCAGYSQMYELLLQKANIAAKYVSGAVRTDLNDIFYSGHSHAWNELDLDGKRYCSDVTWAKDTASSWLLNSENNFFLTHFRDATGDSLWDKNYTHTMYEFMHQPMVRDPHKNAIQQLQFLKNGTPMQFMEDEFTVRFSKSLSVSDIQFYELSYPFVRFESEKAEVAKFHLSDGKSIKYEKGTKAVSFTLKDQFTRISLYVQGIGTLDYCVFNGSQTDFYHFVIDHIDQRSPYCVAMAFLACAKLNDAASFQKLKPYLSNQKMTFKNFQKQAKEMSVEDFQYAIFNATRHYGSFGGFSFEYSNDKSEPRVYLTISEDEKSYSFAGFDTDSWDLNKK
jgi:hypothetical protein